MKQLKSSLDKNAAGFIQLVPDNVEDLWHLYNMVGEEDLVTATTMRKVAKENASGGKDSERVKMKLCLRVEAVDFDPEAEELRIRGRNTTENDHIKLGAYHTLEVTASRALTVAKANWDAMHLEVIHQACNPAASADLAAVLVQEGLAHVVLVGGSCTFLRAKVEANLPRKRGAAAAGYDKAFNKFLENVLQAILKSVDFDVVKCLVLAGPGFTKEQLQAYIRQEAIKRDLKSISTNQSRILLAHASSGYKHALKDVLSVPAVMERIKDTKAGAEVRALNAFYAMMTSNPARAFYGPGHVLAAHDHLAIDTLLISDSLFRSSDLPTRARWVALVEAVRLAKGTVHIFSSMHCSGEQLRQLTGVASILRFPLPELEDMEL
mmetsp:Transcript_32277/g.44770  ORF Transcript_32277/g.44770 Transcript_32277/m.44770 type:complete len:379 (-) Transcript_32277:230-1366(-)|eukprot:CAMPEP_0196580414 /NCGR_PEP_ID=MMETSP1081-20130531/28613_1 /TAXON_ID=36882 /ORGANISM="Pyramimonas amylifera, Strain CCMP720" /LENGTH=378 /DNA_ID=CAMNT_0041900275 /DNA_START=67 /DNA_END=1203 /DNA_ORIENTATION=+